MPSNHSFSNNTHKNQLAFLVDCALYLAVMFLIRELYFERLQFIANGLFWSLTTLLVATWRMHARGIRWKDLGLTQPEHLGKTLLITLGILIAVPASLIVFHLIKDQFALEIIADHSEASAVDKFGPLRNNWSQFFMIMPFVLLQSALEELLDRGFLITWLEKTFSSTTGATALAVLLQAAIFGFRHSYNLSERSITVAIIGLLMGIAYVCFGRNLWPLIITHCTLNTLSMLNRV